MRRAVLLVLLVSVPVLLMLQVLQAYRYVLATEELGALEQLQMERLDENRRLLAGIAVFRSPERLFEVSSEALELRSAEPENVVQVRTPESAEVRP